MTLAHFARLAYSMHRVASRRELLGAMTLGPGLATLRPAWEASAKSKSRKQKLKRNAFGCVNVGGACRGRDAVCCSGICDGKKPKSGEKDRSRCVAHHQGICTPEDRACTDDAAPTPCNPERPSASCFRTTGRAGFCGDDVIPGCIPCQKDADCHEQLSQGAACVVCAGCPNGATCIPPGID
jgi:hypothetical protein